MLHRQMDHLWIWNSSQNAHVACSWQVPSPSSSNNFDFKQFIAECLEISLLPIFLVVDMSLLNLYQCLMCLISSPHSIVCSSIHLVYVMHTNISAKSHSKNWMDDMSFCLACISVTWSSNHMTKIPLRSWQQGLYFTHKPSVPTISGSPANGVSLVHKSSCSRFFESLYRPNKMTCHPFSFLSVIL